MGDGPIRALGVMRNNLYAVSGENFYKGNVLIGQVYGGDRPQLAGNGTEMCVLIAPRAWIYNDDDGTFVEITDDDFLGASSVQFFDNYLTFTSPDTGRWFSSDLAAATDYNALNFATAEGSPDDLVTHVVDHRQALLLGKESCELWDNAGISGFPFSRAANGFIEIGCLAKNSAIKVDQSIIWLASDGTVRRLSGVTPQRISSHALERFIRTATLADCFAFTFTWDGHICYVLSFPEGTWVYDVTTQKWHERKSHNQDNWKATCAASLDGITYVGSDSNELGILDDVFTEWGDILTMSWQYQNVTNQGRPLVHNELQIMLEHGVGLISGQGSDPKIMLEVSDDAGKTFRFMTDRPLGEIGQYRERARWHRLGRSYARVYRPSISDPIRRKVVETKLVAR
jgi:hypothetical protein